MKVQFWRWWWPFWVEPFRVNGYTNYFCSSEAVHAALNAAKWEPKIVEKGEI